MARGQGGPSFHKEGCTCRPCSTRHRKAEALLRGDGSQATITPQKVIEADLGEPSAPLMRAQDRTIRGRIADFITMRALDPKLTNKEIAEKLGISPTTLNNYISTAVKQGWLRFDDPISRIEHEIIPKTLDNLSHMLDEGSEKVTIEVAKGTIFHHYKESKTEGKGPSNILVLNIETVAPPNIEVRSIKGTIVGAPKQLPPIDATLE
jgi:predicted transcriptional regulator